MTYRWLPPEVLWALAGVMATLAAASVAVALLVARRPEQDNAELVARVRTWWVIVGLFGGAMLLSRTAALVLLAVVSLIALREYLGLIPTRRGDRGLRVLAYATVPIQYLLVATQFYDLFLILIPVYAFLALPVRAILGGETKGFVNAVATIHWGLIATVFSLSHAAYLLVFTPYASPRVEPQWPSEAATGQPGAGLLLLLVLLTQANDVAQYIWGKSFGRSKVAPTVSPGKTWAGLIGGVATTTVLAGVVGPPLTLLDVPRSLLTGLLIGVGGFFGDLSISAIKRDLGVKDTGRMLPGHGGVLDRVDSLTYTAPLFFHFMYFLY
ncbi:MAG: phosphatidate cytidylyltransferase [Planctomycetota bacterium]